MKGRKGFTLIELLVVIAIIAVLAAILFPVFAKARNAAKASNCQSNMTQIGRAIKMYLTDWDDTYPTNRFKTTMTMGPTMPLSPYDPVNPQRFTSSINWVEALFSYIESTTKKEDPMTVWRCQGASSVQQTPNSAVSYTFNYNLLEQPEGVIRTASNLMMVREFDRLLDAVCRPSNDSTGKSGTAPINPFFTKNDATLFRQQQPFNNKMHNKGSHILFADGHVKYFGEEFWPAGNLSSQNNWDQETGQWWNWVNRQKNLDKVIAITP